MNSFSLIDLQTEDLDWFAVDSAGEIGQFISAGTRLLPSRVIQSREDLEDVCEFFESLPSLSKAALAPELEAWRSSWINDVGRREQSEGGLEWAERDLDWFAVDTAGEVGHFTSAGTVLLPARVIQFREDLDGVFEYFESLPRLGKALLAPEVEAWRKGWITDEIRKDHWEAFGEWAERGLYSFDCLISGRKGPYYMVAFPESPLLDTRLPPEIAEYLCEFRFPFRFRDLFSRGLNVQGEELSLVEPP